MPPRRATCLLRRSLHRGRHRSLLLHDGGLDHATATATTTIAAIAAAVAATMATAVAAMATMATMTAMAAAVATMTAVAAIAAIAAIAPIATMAAKDEGRSLVLTADEGDADDREEDRETKNNNTVHPQSSSYLQVP